jgi:hypothetical protein
MKRTLVLLMLALLPFSAFAQKDTRETQAELTYDIQPGGPQGGISPQVNKSQINEIIAQINDARRSGDVTKAEQLQYQLDVITNNTSQRIQGNNNGPVPMGEQVNEPIGQNDYNLTIINGTDANWSAATSTDRVTGRLYVVAAKYVTGTGSDTVKVFTSSNNGMSWTLIYRVFYSSDVNFRNDELDIEAINNGTASYIYIVAGFTLGTTKYSTLYRVNSTGGDFFFHNFYAPVDGNAFVNPRITTDNGRYTGATYAYIILTQDSTTGASHYLKTKFSIITNPFVATPTVTNRNTLSNGAYWWNYSGAADSTINYNDIAYSDSASTDIIVTASNFYRAALNNIYLTYSKDYGVTAPSWVPIMVEANVNYKPRLASTQDDSTGGQYIALAYTRQFSATDWDPYYRLTTNNGAVWTSGYVSLATDTTVYTDVVSIPRVKNTFRFAYAVRNGSTGTLWTRSYNAGTFIPQFQLASGMSRDFTPVRAGYRKAATDSCFTLGQGFPSSIGLYAYMGCSGSLTGIENSELPVNFKLSQNYPNPFNPVTKIAYALPKSGLVTLRVYDILGKEVATLVNEVKNAGNYSVDFSASNFTSGVYFYKIETNGFSDIKKMMLIK